MNSQSHDVPSKLVGAMLVHNPSDGDRQCYTLEPNEPFRIGRADDNSLVIELRMVSRHHVEIIWKEHSYELSDLGSTNGTLVSGDMVRSTTIPLTDGDQITIGNVELLFVDEETTEPLVPIVTQTGLTIDAAQRAVSINGAKLLPSLSPPQFTLLQMLTEREAQVVTRDEIAVRIWPNDSINGITEQAIDALVNRLRVRLKELDPDHRFVQTVRGHGFQLVQKSS